MHTILNKNKVNYLPWFVKGGLKDSQIYESNEYPHGCGLQALSLGTKLQRSGHSAFKPFAFADDSIFQIRRIKTDPLPVINFNLGSSESEKEEDTADFAKVMNTADFAKECFLNDGKFTEECFLKEDKFSKGGFSFITED